MEKLLLPENHFVFYLSKETNEICSPLFEAYKIKFFNYYRYFNEGHFCGLVTSSANMVIHHMKQGYIFAPDVVKKSLTDKFSYILMPDLDDGFSQAIKDYQSLFDVYNPLYLFEQHSEYFDLFVYAYEGIKYEAVNHYLLNMKIFEKFKTYFIEKANKLIEEFSKNLILLPPSMRVKTKNLPIKKDDNIEKLIIHYGLALTEREKGCLRLLLEGKTSAKLIAKYFNLSPRTIENYIDSLKQKFGVYSKNQLIIKVCKDYEKIWLEDNIE